MFANAWLIIIVGALLSVVVPIWWRARRRAGPEAALATAATPAMPTIATPSPCEVACAHVAEALDAAGGHAPVYSDTAFEIPPVIQPEGWWGEKSQPGDPWPTPPAELYAKFVALKGQSAVAACSAVQALLDERGVGHGPAAVAAAAKGRENERHFHRTIYGASLPAVSDDGRDALIAWSYLAGGLDGRANISWLKRDADGKWRQESSTLLWIS